MVGCKALATHYGVPLARILGHKEVAAPLGRKSDPNFDMASFRLAVLNYKTPEVPEVITPEDVKKIADAVQTMDALVSREANAATASGTAAAVEKPSISE